ncbi:hypothetical protein NW752_011081 [Fusarium irregulare]|uniref:Uncharacterized protein n=1 Tax=Fusarium irregulare TaxID=2494466 RepID=A0A9W8PE17_9HYPO|nr:hypothetical protein NW766_012108 [Fusarium irregulare]KAJ4005753.1 hypothetical protein NW752_011081 [Fusarium irregulare]
MDSFHFTDEAKAQLREGFEREVNKFAERLESLSFDFEENDDGDEDSAAHDDNESVSGKVSITESAYEPYRSGRSFPSKVYSDSSFFSRCNALRGSQTSSSSRQTGSISTISQRQDTKRDEAMEQRDLIRAEKAKRTRLARIGRSVTEASVRTNDLLKEMEETRRGQDAVAGSVDGQLTELLNRYRRSETERHNLAAKYNKVNKEIGDYDCYQEASLSSITR